MDITSDQYIRDSDGHVIISFCDEISPTLQGYILGAVENSSLPIPGLWYFPGPMVPRQVSSYARNTMGRVDLGDVNALIASYSNPNARIRYETVGSGKTSRKVVHYGYKYNYKTKKTNEPAPEMPDTIKNLREIIRRNIVDELGDRKLDQCIVNAYEPGPGINAHYDHLDYDDYICCFTFGSGATMTFTHLETRKVVDVYINPNSLYVMSGDARYKWSHELAQRKSDVVGGTRVPRGRRVSITFRNLKLK